MAYPTVVMVSALSRELSPFDPTWSVPQLQEQLARALTGEGPALSTVEIAQQYVDEKTALVVRTSGSTGSPKSVALSSAALLTNARATHSFLNANPGQRWSLLLPTTHIAGINVVIRSLELGTACVTVSEMADFTAIVPTQLFRALHGDAELFHHLQNCKSVLVGGGALERTLRDEALSRGIHIIESYGMTETCGGVIYDGIPISGVEVRLDQGRIELRGPQISARYLEGEIPLHDGWYVTSDFGVIEDGKLQVQGRIDDQIISGGEKISLSAVENFLRNQYPSFEIVAFAKSDPEWGERLCLASTSSLAIDTISHSLKSEFGNHASPKEILKVASIPYLSIGKPDRKKLAHDYA